MFDVCFFASPARILTLSLPPPLYSPCIAACLVSGARPLPPSCLAVRVLCRLSPPSFSRFFHVSAAQTVCVLTSSSSPYLPMCSCVHRVRLRARSFPPKKTTTAVGNFPLCARLWREYANFEALHGGESAVSAVEGILQAAESRGVVAVNTNANIDSANNGKGGSKNIDSNKAASTGAGASARAGAGVGAGEKRAVSTGAAVSAASFLAAPSSSMEN